MIGHVECSLTRHGLFEQSSIHKKHWVTWTYFRQYELWICLHWYFTAFNNQECSYPTSWYHTGTLQFTYMMKDSSSDVVLMAKECEQASSLFVVPYLNKEKKYLPKMVSLLCKPNDIFLRLSSFYIFICNDLVTIPTQYW